jgi:hypothetical protein
MEQTRNVDFLTRDVEIKGSNPIIVLCTYSHNGDNLCQVISNKFQQLKSYGADTKCSL